MNVDSNPIGSYYPFYYGWKPEYLSCHKLVLGTEMRPVETLDPKYKIRYSQEFDNCVINKADREWMTCPPGPLTVDVSGGDLVRNLSEWKKLRAWYSGHSSGGGLDPGLGQPTAGLGTNEGGNQFCPDAGTWT